MNEKRLKRIRRSLGDVNEEALLFTDEEINEVLEENESDNYVLSVLYLQKAGRLIESESHIKSIKAGNEELEHLNACDLQRMALEQSKKYGEFYAIERREKENNENEDKAESFFVY